MESFLSDYLALFQNLTLPGFFYLLGVVVLIKAFTEIDLIEKIKNNPKFALYISILVVVFSFIIGLTAHLALQQVKTWLMFIFDYRGPKPLKGYELFNSVYGVLIMFRHLIISILFLVISIGTYLNRTKKKLKKRWFFSIMYILSISILLLAYRKIHCVLAAWSIGNQSYLFWIFVGFVLLFFIISLIMIIWLVKWNKKIVMAKKKLKLWMKSLIK